MASYRELIKLLREADGDIGGCLEIYELRAGKKFLEHEVKIAEQKLRDLYTNFNKKWKQRGICRIWKKFEEKHDSWLSKILCLSCTGQDENRNSISSNGGRRKLPFSECSERSKRRKVHEVLSMCENDPLLMLHSAKKTSSQCGNRNLSKIVGEVIKDQSKDMVKLISNKPKAMAIPQATEFYINLRFTAEKYKELRRNAISLNHQDLYPPYYLIERYRKQCRPEGIKVSSSEASVPWKNLIQHTVSRIFEAYPEIKELVKPQGHAAQIYFIFSCGSDGTGCQSRYNQKIDEVADDSHLYVTSMIPIQLKTDENTVLWTNEDANSSFSVRTQKIIFAKEDSKLTKKEFKEMKEEIESIEPFSISISEGNFNNK